jgi:di/tricarboxylate transporter
MAQSMLAIIITPVRNSRAMEISTPIIITLLLIVVTLYAFVKEVAPSDLIALTILCCTVLFGLVDSKKVLDVFRNEAPLTIGALFIIGTALEKSGGVRQISRLIQKMAGGGLRSTLLIFCGVAAFFSAFMNNTAIVAIMLPVALGLARSKDIPASKLLIPLSYASILGGCCTLIGTSTNIVVSGALQNYGLQKIQMFELAAIGVPLACVGIAYLVIFGPKLLPNRSSVIGMLNDQQRTSPLFHILVEKQSPLIGQRLLDSPIFNPKSGIHMMEVRRNGERMMLPVNQIVIEANDRFLIGVHGRRNKAATADELLPNMGIQTLSKIEGVVTELVITEESELINRTLAAADFRQRYNCVVLAVHRNGKNITERLANTELDHGDTLLVLTPRNNLKSLQDSHNFVLTDSVESSIPRLYSKATLTWAILLAVVVSVTVIPGVQMHIASLIGALAILWIRIISMREAYAGVDWPIIFMLYGMLALGLAMDETGTAEWLALGFVKVAKEIASPELLPYFALSAVILLTLALTEVLSNNATALMMVPIVVNLAKSLEVSAMPFIIGICIGASCAFMLPMGYQTHMMVYGPGGYKFSDFIRIGLPMNVITWIMASAIIPLVWKF